MQDRKIICIIDDDKIYQFAASKLLQKYHPDVSVICFDHGRSAIEFIENHKSNPGRLPDVILLDINMPVLDGWGFLAKFALFKNELTKPVKIYIVSSSIDNRDLQKANEYTEVTSYLIKPLREENYKGIFD
jgi:CheY-like chemotaxis protein